MENHTRLVGTRKRIHSGDDETQQWSNQLLFKTKPVLTVSNTKGTKGISSGRVYFLQLRPSVCVVCGLFLLSCQRNPLTSAGPTLFQFQTSLPVNN